MKEVIMDKQLSFEINIDGGWKQVPPGGSYIMH